ncbi:MAG: nuclear transport factor 2 family protein [Rhodocyclaceae bacterium]|nr:nuclear transport factor 2 family protein [Rhodocyclaceae bacterium]
MSFARCAVFIVLVGNFFVSTQPSAHVPRGPSPEQTRVQVTELLTDFLAPGKNDKPETHERFWAEDLVYTTSGGIVKTKADIRKSFVESALPAKSKTNPAVSPPAVTAVYAAEDVLVRPYGEIAALTFRLVARDANGETTYYRNSAAFIYRDGRWQAITWQATKVPPTEKPTK